MKRLIAIGLGSVLLSGCFQEMKAEDVLYEVFENGGSKDVSYTINMTSTDLDGAKTDMHEWYDGNGQSKRITYKNDEIIYEDVTNNDVSMTKDYENEVVTNNDYYGEERDAIGYVSPFEQVEELVRYYSGSFKAEVVGEETLLGRETTHLRLEVRPERDIGMISEINLWFDNKTWVVLKEQIKDGDRDFTREATSFELVNDFPDGTFEIENEEGFSEESFIDLFKPEPVTLKEASEQYQSDFLTFDESFIYDSGFIRPDPDIDNSYVLNLTFTDDRGEVFLYIEPEWRLVEIEGLEKKTEVRGQEALMVDETSLLTFNWQENGLQYFVEFTGDYSSEVAEEILSNMTFTSK
ncbi:LolA family protein [Alkalicoccobacillus porphyridii]|uniref:Outer membrane lipoprotein carrier protein LolA n=1 Tax=Alkalicoccobacillus porphyridii TaxID=2597270 RepID=A0A553ZZL4_9BACI|nr:outer membrane lipoprotein carrier protein LolA [Alkalicoccobacillus porphyridii]TSB46884.1 outer membrane lipoprotein carrier protein LolA [Alkalicoccobacillus porphyridii]